MNTPICDFVRAYAGSGCLRMHMPGHKGTGPLGAEQLDITEIAGADSLYEADGIIAESEQNASTLFGCPTFYSTEGSSQCIRAMLLLILRHAVQNGKKPLIWAGRNAHKTFLSAVALLDPEVEWMQGDERSYLSCLPSAKTLEKRFGEAKKNGRLPAALYLTSPDYLGFCADLSAISKVCKTYGVLLAVDNAHGAYLRFLNPSRHPIDLGADLCCDSAHKTLPVLTGGAYLHLAPHVPEELTKQAKNALSMFGSTSPSYLILQSLDAANADLASGYPDRLRALCKDMDRLKKELTEHGFECVGEEAIKLTLLPKSFGYRGTELAEVLRNQRIECEFADPDAIVFMPSPTGNRGEIRTLETALLNLGKRAPISEQPPGLPDPAPVCSIRTAMLAPQTALPTEQAVGRILADASVGCPPAVPIAICGERIGEEALRCFRYYGIETCRVMNSKTDL